MEIEIYQLIEGARRARGLTVVIDVFRAFTVECYAFAAGAKEILAVGDVETAYRLKREDPYLLLIGERGGMKCPGFDCGNSPSELGRLDLRGRTIVHTTSAGTQGIVSAEKADEILAGSLVNARAIADYIRVQAPKRVSLVCMGLAGRTETEEDTLCAKYIQALLNHERPDITAEIDDLRNTSGRKFFDPMRQTAFPQPDFELSAQLNRFNFVLAVERGGEVNRVRRVDVNSGSL